MGHFDPFIQTQKPIPLKANFNNKADNLLMCDCSVIAAKVHVSTTVCRVVEEAEMSSLERRLKRVLLNDTTECEQLKRNT